MTKNIDLEFTPATYFRPQRLESYLLSKVKGAVIRKKLQVLLDAGRQVEVRELLGTRGISEHDRKVLESCHPMFMGGNYLPDTNEGEVEVARIRIASTTCDVTSVYAKPVDGVIRYRVVDEYGGDTLSGTAEATTRTPMKLGEFADFFLGAWSLMDALEMNFDGDQKASLAFFSVESEFYPALDGLCRLRVIERFPEQEEDEDDLEEEAGEELCPYCGSSVECPHLLVVVDKTFRTAERGVLMRAFNRRWSSIQEGNVDNHEFEEGEYFEELLDEVRSLADSSAESTHEGAPGMSSANSVFFVSSRRKAAAALKKFGVGLDLPRSRVEDIRSTQGSNVSDQNALFVTALQDLAATTSILIQHLSVDNNDKSHEAVTILLMQGLHTLGAESVAMKQFFPVFDVIKRRIDSGNLPGALGQAELFQTQLSEIITMVSR